MSEKQNDYATKVYNTLREAGVRIKLSSESLTLNKRIREAEIRRVPYIIVVGEKEMGNKTINVRHYTKGTVGELTLDHFSKKILEEIKSRSN